MTELALFTVRVNEPSRSVEMPLVVPVSKTVAPMTGIPVLSTTTPCTLYEPFWACARGGGNQR